MLLGKTVVQLFVGRVGVGLATANGTNNRRRVKSKCISVGIIGEKRRYSFQRFAF